MLEEHIVKLHNKAMRVVTAEKLHGGSVMSLSLSSGGGFTVYFDCDEMLTGYVVTVYIFLEKGFKTLNIEE